MNKELKTYAVLTYIFIFISTANAQVDTYVTASETSDRIASINNQLELLTVEVPNLLDMVNVNINNTDLSNFLRAVAKVHNININVSNELSGIPIANGFNNVTIKDLLLFLSKEYQLAIDITGSIIAIKKYVKPAEPPTEKEILVRYDLSGKRLSLDLQNDLLPKVFRKITKETGKNLLYAPNLENKNISIYLEQVPFDIAMDKLAETNQMAMKVSDNGFYEFEAIEEDGSVQNTFRSYQQNSKVPYQIVNKADKLLKVDLTNYPIDQLIKDLANDLNINIFMASPLTDVGNITLSFGEISFDQLLYEIFTSTKKENTRNNERGNPGNRINNNSGNSQQEFSSSPNSSSTNSYTYKKEGDSYYFGIESQLSIKKIEIIPMMHRSITMLGDANSVGGLQNNRNFVSGGTSFFGNDVNNNSNFSNATGNRSFNERRSSGGSSISSSSDTTISSISEIFPESVIQGLDVKVDIELNSFVVSGSGRNVKNFKDFITYIDKPIPLILIEVMILEVNRSATVETGVEFGIGNEPSVKEGVVFPEANLTLGANTVNRIIGGFDGFGSLNLGNVVPNFYMDIKAMESNGNLKILSTPKLSTLNGHKAYLSSGETTYYAVTNQSFFGSQIPQTSQIVNYQPIDAELALEFKPFVSGDGQITLEIQVVQSNFSGTRIAEDAPPDINSRKFSSIMRMRANDVAILGGIEQKIKNDSGSGVPILSRIPIIKWLFSKRRREDARRKLNVIIKPTIFY